LVVFHKTWGYFHQKRGATGAIVHVSFGGSTGEGMTPMDTPMKVKDKVSLFLCLHNDKIKKLLLSNIGISNVLRMMVMMIEYGYAMNKTDLGV
jgi:hypothetical protein